MKSTFTALLMALLLCGCAARTDPLQEETEPSVPEAPELQEEEQSEEPSPPPEDTVTIKDSSVSITLGRPQSYDSICLQGLSKAGELTIRINDGEIYTQENASSLRYCYLGPQAAENISVQLPEGGSVEQFSLSSPKEGLLSAYLPYNAFTESMLTDGRLQTLDRLTVNVGCYWRADGSLEVKSSLSDMLSQIHDANPELEIFCTINPKAGGAAAILNKESRTVLIQNMLDFCQTHSLAGVDIDWEFPAEDQWDEFSDLIIELSQSLAESDRSLSLAFYPQDITLSPEAVTAIDTVHMMAYDQFDEQGRHSTYETAVEAIDYFLALGFDAGQLCLGIPAYGRPLSSEALWPLYNEYADQLADGTNLLGVYYFNSPQLAQDKAVLARERELQGVFFYHLGCDSADDSSLIQAVSQIFQ